MICVYVPVTSLASPNVKFQIFSKLQKLSFLQLTFKWQNLFNYLNIQ